MWSVDELNQLDETLCIQLRLALASPLWKNLPYGVQINPRAWNVDVVDIKPGRRACVQITIPWRPGHLEHQPLHYVLVAWRNGTADPIHRLLLGFNDHQNREQCGRRLLFYDALAHAFICQFRASSRKETPAPKPFFRNRRARRLLMAMTRRLRDIKQ